MMHHHRNTAAAAILAAAGVLAVPNYVAGDTRTHSVEISDFQFNPPTLRVKAGDTITWTNRDFIPHTASADEGSGVDLETGELVTDASRSILIKATQSFDYICRYHPTMKGQIIVEQ